MSCLNCSADEINAEHERCVTATVSAAEHWRKCGAMLLEKKVEMHRTFKRWVVDHCAFSYRQAVRYMHFATKVPTGHFSNSVDLRAHIGERSGPDTDNGKTDKPKRQTKADLRAVQKAERAAAEKQKDEAIASRLRSGAGLREVMDELHASTARVQRIYANEIVPQLLAGNWEEEIQASPCPALEVAKRWDICTAATVVNGKRGSVRKFVKERFDIDIGPLDSARAIVLYGSDELVDLCSTGKVPLSTAEVVAKKFPKETQVYKLNGFATRQDEGDLAHQLLDRLSRMLDQQSIWERDHGSEWSQLESLARSAGEVDRAEIVKTTRAMMSWLELIAEIFGDSQWDISQPTSEQPTT